MKHNLARLTTVILLPLVAAVAAVLALSGCSAATPASHTTSTAAQSSCDLTPAPPSGFTEQKTSVGGIGINYVRGGHCPTLLLVAGYPQTWYAWDDILPELAKHYTVVAPDLPGAGGSDAPAGVAPYTKKAMAGERAVLVHMARGTRRATRTSETSETCATPDTSCRLKSPVETG